MCTNNSNDIKKNFRKRVLKYKNDSMEKSIVEIFSLTLLLQRTLCPITTTIFVFVWYVGKIVRASKIKHNVLFDFSLDRKS